MGASTRQLAAEESQSQVSQFIYKDTAQAAHATTVNNEVSAPKLTPVIKKTLNNKTTCPDDNQKDTSNVNQKVESASNAPANTANDESETAAEIKQATSIGFKNEIANVDGNEVKILKSKASEEALATMTSVERKSVTERDGGLPETEIISSTHTLLENNPNNKKSTGALINKTGDENNKQNSTAGKKLEEYIEKAAASLPK